ncbi:DNA-directed RNA polymerase subunit omega [Rickettsia typhi]|uniref:DNA-directed RNA polymerase subunit omega n=2 Tax=Rickettsia typhi TaxID=785 RepID=RPOZ_RICTY|nr:DNA-directed RNA polymerase subunit omega [Rickettsia typhi]Q68WF8.1 RecName: Full=DNA-directed RNA polymerase subunit omega; Short=RNAP omega subunit; AltName: Full=RNA polymerase omega subunit; AltName: Full=Transcriptase subunit omega [Rickettsia typhi str. Wilmington]AAU04034.1 RNA nucleotidyltransferase (DNA-directed) [Rickettsia typhi str. Wilmington]AFE54412.1 DNA-directed RNA polymerase subunit omega [Rickettsia typhi str. TH1527]AFE55250.1 DNA-directed RNA polymerase subunit omega [
MARITAEDCNKIIPDRFRLVVLATRYAKLLNYKVETNQIKKEKRDKPPVISLRRIAAGKVSVPQLEQDLINSLRTSSMIEPLVNQDESEDVEEKFEYLPEVYIGEDYSDLDDQIFINENGEDYETDK